MAFPAGTDRILPDLDTLPDFELPSVEAFMAQEGTADSLEGFDSGTLTVTDLGWSSCLLFNGRPWQTVTWKVDTAAEAAGWMDAFTRWVNAQLARMGTRQVSVRGQLALVSRRPRRHALRGDRSWVTRARSTP